MKPLVSKPSPPDIEKMSVRELRRECRLLRSQVVTTYNRGYQEGWETCAEKIIEAAKKKD